MALSSIYTPNTPQGTQQVNNTQQPINDNFQDIASLFAVNHVPFNTADDFGKHNFVNFVTQSSDPTTASAEMALYTKAVSGDTNGVELFYRYPSNGSVLQLTGVTASSGSTGTGGGAFSRISTSSTAVGTPYVGYWQYLSNGILMMTWYVNNGTTTSDTITIVIPNSTNCYTTTGSSTMPSFTSAIYNMQMEPTNPSGNPTGYNYANNAITIVDTTTATLYYTGSLSTGGQASIVITAIGI